MTPIAAAIVASLTMGQPPTDLDGDIAEAKTFLVSGLSAWAVSYLTLIGPSLAMRKMSGISAGRIMTPLIGPYWAAASQRDLAPQGWLVLGMMGTLQMVSFGLALYGGTELALLRGAKRAGRRRAMSRRFRLTPTASGAQLTVRF